MYTLRSLETSICQLKLKCEYKLYRTKIVPKDEGKSVDATIKQSMNMTNEVFIFTSKIDAIKT